MNEVGIEDDLADGPNFLWGELIGMGTGAGGLILEAAVTLGTPPAVVARASEAEDRERVLGRDESTSSFGGSQDPGLGRALGEAFAVEVNIEGPKECALEVDDRAETITLVSKSGLDDLKGRLCGFEQIAPGGVAEATVDPGMRRGSGDLELPK